MRVLIYAAIATALLSRDTLAKAEDDPLYSGRGFKTGKCYRHLAIRKCKNKPQSHCRLEVFPHRSSALPFELEGKNAILIDGKETSDYGIFDFYFKNYLDGVPIAEILSIKRIPLKDFEDSQELDSIAHVSNCPEAK